MQTNIQRTGHIASLDLLRGIAALAVCFFHILANTAFEHIPIIKSILLKGYLGLALFFIISGFIIPYSMYMNKYTFKKFPRYMLKRSCRIEPPYIISFLLIVLMRFIHTAIHGGWYHLDLKQFLLHFFYLNQYFGKEAYTLVYWTLAIEFQYYIIIGLLFSLLMHKNKFIPLVLFFVWAYICWIIMLPYNFFIFQYGLLFMAGILIFLFKINHISIKIFLLFLGITLFLMYFKNGIDIVLTTLFATIVIFIVNKQWKVTNFLGMISFSLYLVHAEASGWLDLYIRDYIPNQLVLKLITLVFAFLFATGFYYLFERPAFKFSKKISYRN